MGAATVQDRPTQRLRKLTQAQEDAIEYIYSRGVRGATCDEVEQALSLLHQSCSPMLLRLRERRILTYKYDPKSEEYVTRSTQRGIPALVYFFNEDLE